MREAKETCSGGLGWVGSCRIQGSTLLGVILSFSIGSALGHHPFLMGILMPWAIFLFLELTLVQGCGLANGEFLVNKCVISNLSSIHRHVKLRYGRHFVWWTELEFGWIFLDYKQW